LQPIDVEGMLYLIPAMLIGLTFHEFAHAFAAYKLGDPTAKNMGRLTVNPLKHLDVVGTLFLLVFRFGWAKPVPFNPLHFKGDRQRGILLVSLAGPASNLLIAIVTAFIWKFTVPQSDIINRIIGNIFYINVILAVFNFIPVPPLDGSKILAGILPRKYSHIMYNLEKYGFLILILLLVFGIFDLILWPLVDFVRFIISAIVGIRL